MIYLANKPKELLPSDLDGKTVKVIADFDSGFEYIEILGKISEADCIPIGICRFNCSTILDCPQKEYIENILECKVDISTIYAGEIIISAYPDRPFLSSIRKDQVQVLTEQEFEVIKIIES